MVLKLFDDNDSDSGDISKIEVNEEYARRFQHNKKREDLQRFQELKKKGLVSSSEDEDESDSESSDDGLDHEKIIGPSSMDKQFFDALIRIKNQDPSLKQKNVKLFESDPSSDEDGDETENGIENKGKKPMYLKDVVAKHLIEDGPDFEDKEYVKKTYSEEQEDLRKAFLEAVEADMADDGEVDLLRVKEKEEGEDEETIHKEELERKLDDYFGGAEALDENAKFLKDFFMNRMWIEKDHKDWKVGEEELEMISEDEKEIEKQEEYEYRFQENAGDRVMGHARKVEGSVRKKTNARKEHRKSKEERMAIAEKEREEELKHLKNLKKQEMQEKMKKIMKTAGIREDEIIPLNTAEIEDEFDPEEYDRMMKKAFDDKYYNAEDADPDFSSDNDDDVIEKPDFEKEDELLGLPKGWDESGSGDGFLAARERILKHKMDDSDGHGLEEGEERIEEEMISGEGKRKRKRKTALLEKAKEALMDEYYKLDYEDTIGNLKTRFKYTRTKPNRFGLSGAEILMMDDKELNQYVSLKKIVPYREKEWKLTNQKRYQLKMRTKEVLRGENLDKKKTFKKKSMDAIKSKPLDASTNQEEAPPEQTNSDEGKLSRKARRRQRQAELKLSHSRLVAYGKIPSKSKVKRKK